jgi:hypothetical protein
MALAACLQGSILARAQHDEQAGDTGAWEGHATSIVLRRVGVAPIKEVGVDHGGTTIHAS